MPDIDDVRRQYQELEETIREQNRLRDSDSEHYDLDALDRATRERSRLEMEHQRSGGSLDDLRRSPEPTGGAPSGTEGVETPSAGPPEPDPLTSTADQLTRQIEALGEQPHPGVRLDTENNQVVGGTREQLDENRRWQEQRQVLEQEQAAAQAEEAFNAAGGTEGFTRAELADFQRRKKEIEQQRAELAAVNERIEHWDNLRLQAGGQLESGRTDTHPGAGAGAGTAAGNRYDAELRPLYAEQSRLMLELKAKYDGLAAAVGAAVDRQRESAGVKIDLPATVEEAFIRRVLDRMGLPHAESESQSKDSRVGFFFGGLYGQLAGTFGFQHSPLAGCLTLFFLAVLGVSLAVGLALLFSGGDSGDGDANAQAQAAAASATALSLAASPSSVEPTNTPSPDDASQGGAQGAGAQSAVPTDTPQPSATTPPPPLATDTPQPSATTPPPPVPTNTPVPPTSTSTPEPGLDPTGSYAVNFQKTKGNCASFPAAIFGDTWQVTVTGEAGGLLTISILQNSNNVLLLGTFDPKTGQFNVANDSETAAGEFTNLLVMILIYTFDSPLCTVSLEFNGSGPKTGG